MLIQRYKDTDMWLVAKYSVKMQKTILSSQSYAEFSPQGNIKIILDVTDVRYTIVPDEELDLFYNMLGTGGSRLWIPILCNGILS